MEQQFTHDVFKKLKRRKRRRIWKKIVGVMICLVVFWTTYMMILPAITKETKSFCDIPEHTHGEECYRQVLLCEEHVHTDACFAAEPPLVCTLSAEGHTHTKECITQTETVLTCTATEGEEHTHTDACYSVNMIYGCGQVATPAHFHTAECYGKPEQLCTIPTDGAHAHTEECYGRELICQQQEHTHSLACYADPSADVETEEQWRATLPWLSDVSKENVAAIAESQLRYTESTKNYIVDSNGEPKGYTRYGAWYGSPYEDWNAMFASFCLRYAGVNYSYDAACVSWVNKLKDRGLYKTASEYVPQRGDLVFFDWERDGTVDSVGIVSAVEDLKFKVIEGDKENRVAETEYELFDKRIAGYGEVVIPQNTTDTVIPEQQSGVAPIDVNAWAELVQPAAKRAGSALRAPGQTRGIPLDLTPYINAVNMYDSAGNPIDSGSVVTEGDLIEFKIEYTVTGQQLGVMNGETVTVNTDTLRYALPQLFQIIQSDSGNILSSVGVVVGSYVIDNESGTITLTFTDSYVEQNAKGIQINGFVSFFSTVTRITENESESQEFEFTDNITLGIVIEEKDEAVGDLTIEKSKVSVDGEELIYELTVTSGEGTNGPITITDEMSEGLSFVEGIGAWNSQGSAIRNVRFQPSADNSSFTLSLPEMAAGASYVVRYRCKADIDLLGNDMTVHNSATVTGKDSHDKELKDKTTVGHTFDVLKKTGVENGDGTISWSITVNQAKVDISGWELVDVIGNTSFTGPVTISDVNGNILYEQVNLPITFPQGSTDTYVITYTTRHTIAEGDTIYNRAVLRDGDTDVTVVSGVGVGNPLTKTGEAGALIEDAQGNFLVPITWTVTVDTANSSIAAGEYFYDKMNGAYHTAEMYMTYDQLMAALANIEAELNRVGSSIRDVRVEGYVEGYVTGESYGRVYDLQTLKNDPNCRDYLYERFRVTLGSQVPQGQLLTFTYETYGIFPNNVVEDREFKNCFNISEHYEVEAIEKFSSGTLKATKTALSYYDPSIPGQQWHWGNTDWSGVEGTSYFEYEKLHDSYLAWSIELSVPPGYSNTDDMVIYEDLPEGVTVRKLGMPFLSNLPTTYLSMENMEPGKTYDWTFTIWPIDQYNIYGPDRTGAQDVSITVKVTDSGDLEITMPGALLRLMGDLAKLHAQPEWYSYLFVYTQINDDFEWTPESEGATVYVDSFQNRFAIKDEDGEVFDIGSQTQVITKDETSGVIRKQGSTDSNNLINYSVILNAYKRDLIENAGLLTVYDELTYTSTEYDPLRLRLVPGSVKLYEIDMASDGSYTKLSELTANYSYEESSTEQGGITSWTHTIRMNVPDDKSLLLEYSYKASGEKNVAHNIQNACTITGVAEGGIEGDHKVEIEVKDATAQADTKGVMLYKVDAYSDGIFLEEARFNIYIWNEEQGKYIIVHHSYDGSTDFVTDENGMIVLDGTTIAQDQFAYNTAYYIVEVESPNGYFISPEPFYFYIVHDNTVAYPPCLPDGFTGQPLVSGDIIYRQNVSEYTGIRVEKYWEDYNGNPQTVTGEKVSAVTLELWQMLEGDPTSAKCYGTYTMTPDEEGNWSLVIDGLPKATKNADNTKGTEYLYYIKEVGVQGYELEDVINNDGINTGTIKLVNRALEGYILPETGGIGTQMYTMAGLLLVVISTAFLMYNHTKRRREDYDSS